MPCYTPEPTEEEDNERGYLSKRQFEALVCGITRKNGIEHLLSLDLDEVGIPPETIKKWWIKHQKEDQIREARCKAEKEKAEAIASLTLEQRKALGIDVVDLSQVYRPFDN